MFSLKANIFSNLEKEILSLQGFRQPVEEQKTDLGLGSICSSFPGQTFPFAAVHEFKSANPESKSATLGFVSCILSRIMKTEGISVWIHSGRTVFPPALTGFGVAPERIIFINATTEKDSLWITEEALACEGLSAVVAELHEINFISSRKFQLAVEKSRVTGMLMSSQQKYSVNACTARWEISQLPSGAPHNLPGVGFPRWQVKLVKMRNGRPGTWNLEWSKGNFRLLDVPDEMTLVGQKLKVV